MTFGELKREVEERTGVTEAYTLTADDIRRAVALLEGDELKLGYYNAYKVPNREVEIKLLNNGKEENKN